MNKFFTLTLVVFLTHQISAQTIFQSKALTLGTEENNGLYKSLKEFKLIELDLKKLNALCKSKKTGIDFQLRIADYNWTVSLEENELRAPHYQVAENGKGVNSLFGSCITYKGSLNGNTNQPVRLAIADDLLDGYVTDDGDIIFIKPMSKMVRNYQNENHFVVFKLSDIIDDPTVGACGIEESKNIKKVLDKTRSNETARATTSCRVLEIATEADFEFFQANSSDVTTANNNILGILNQVEGVYQTTFNVRFLIPFQSVWSTSIDPYSEVSTQVSGTNVVDELANWWQTNRSSVSRDIVHFFSAKTGHGVKGSARILGGAVCDNMVNSYAFTATVGIHDLIITTAHEIGHLFSATHPDPSGAACSPTRTIMCIDPNNLGRALQFATFSQDEINTWINGHNACLTDVLNVNITGSPVCSSLQMAVTGLPPNSSVTSWASSAPSLVSVTSGGMATRLNDYNGSANVTANGNYGNSGCTFTSTALVWAGPPNVTGSFNGGPMAFNDPANFNMVCTQTYGSTSMQLTGAASGSWQLISASPSNGIYWWQTGNNITVYFYGNNQTARLRFTTFNSCGSVVNDYYFKSYSCGGGGGGCTSFTVSPNPSSHILGIKASSSPCGTSIASSEDINSASTRAIGSINLYSFADGQLKHSQEFPDKPKQVDLNISNLSKGVYILTISDGSYLESHRVIVN